MKSFSATRAAVKKLIIVLAAANFVAFLLFSLKSYEPVVSDERQVHQMFQQASGSINELHINKALTEAKENVLGELQQEEMEAGNRGNILPKNKRSILILSYWRSGSTFLYDLITSFPGTYGYFEPLSPILKDHHKLLQHANFTLRSEVTSLIKDYLQCNIKNRSRSYFEFVSKDYLNLDTRVKKACETPSLSLDQVLCYNPVLHKGMCQSMPVVVMKLVRLEGGFIPELLQNQDLDLKIVVLMRDPRDVMMSREGVMFCRTSDTCMNASLTCAEMMRTFDTVAKYQATYHDRLYFLRYEDLVRNLRQATKNLFAFLELPLTRSVSRFLQTHTQLNSLEAKVMSNYEFSTYRSSVQVLTRWRKKNYFPAVKKVQLECAQVLKKLKYKIFNDVFEFTNIQISNVL